MRDIKVEFQKRNQKSLSAMLKADFPGDSKNMLLAILGDNWAIDINVHKTTSDPHIKAMSFLPLNPYFSLSKRIYFIISLITTSCISF